MKFITNDKNILEQKLIYHLKRKMEDRECHLTYLNNKKTRKTNC